jgi:hypothetical protein
LLDEGRGRPRPSLLVKRLSANADNEEEMDLKREIKIADLSPQMRIALIVALAVAALGLGFFILHRSHGQSPSATPVTPTPAAVAPAAPVAKPAHRVVHRAVQPQPAPPAPQPTATSDDQSQLPSNVAGALDAGKNVVVALYAPNVKIDQIALEEAQAGAESAGATFTSVDVTTPDVNGLAAKYSVLHDPSVLVLDPSGGLLVKIDGFADKETVAQAASPGQQ